MATDIKLLRWIERAGTGERDGAGVLLKDFVDAEIARAGIELKTLRDERDHWKKLALHWHAKAQELLPATEKARESNRTRQLRFRRKNQFAPPLPALDTPMDTWHDPAAPVVADDADETDSDDLGF